MEYHKIVIKQIPAILFAHRYQTNRYALDFQKSERLIEISYIEHGDVVKMWHDGRQLPVPASSVACALFEEPFMMRSSAQVHCHFTVGFTMDYEAFPVTKQEIAASAWDAAPNQMTVILPNYLHITPQNDFIEHRIKQIIRSHTGRNGAGGIQCVSYLIGLLSDITQDCIRNALVELHGELSPGSIVYAERAVQYISAHIERKIIVDEIAEALKISSGYLSNLFRAVTGYTLIEYINRVKLDRVKELICSKNATLKEAGESVGIYDCNYLSRIFKKYTNLTVREFKMLHDLPQIT